MLHEPEGAEKGNQKASPAGGGAPDKAEGLRSALVKALGQPDAQTAFDVFGSELADEAFAGIFDQPRQGDGREADP
jgi:hypothetical protein